MPLFRLNIVLSHFNRVNRFFKEKSKSTVYAKTLPVIECQSPSLSGGGVGRTEKSFL